MSEQDFSFPKRVRLTTPTDYKKVFANPIRSSDSYFTLLAIRNEYTHPRLGLVVAKKNVKKAVHRNRIKRVIREQFRLHRNSITNIDMVVLVHKEVLGASSSLLAKSLKKHWLRLESRCNT